MKVLIASHDSDTVDTIAAYLDAAGHVVEKCSTLDEAGWWFEDGSIDVAVIDCGRNGRLPDEIARLPARPPVLAIADEARSRTLAALLDSGADDALSIPLDMGETLARLRALQRRAAGVRTAKIVIGDLTLDPAAKGVTRAGRPIHITRSEYDLLELLALRPGQCLSKEQILSSLYREADEPELKIVDVFVCKLRKKVGAHVIETVWGQGYRIAPRNDVEQRSAAA